jgi:hypothetical protein
MLFLGGIELRRLEHGGGDGLVEDAAFLQRALRALGFPLLPFVQVEDGGAVLRTAPTASSSLIRTAR